MQMDEWFPFVRSPFFLSTLVAALVSGYAVLSNFFVLEETLPRIVEARKAMHASAEEPDQTMPLLENGSGAASAAATTVV